MSTLSELLTNITQGADDDRAYILAAALNLYSESRRRLYGRVLFTPNDIRSLGQITSLLLLDTEVDTPLAPARSRELTTEEEKGLLEGLERKVERRT